MTTAKKSRFALTAVLSQMLTASFLFGAPAAGVKVAASFYDLKAKVLRRNETIDFSIYKNKVILVVNTASKCGYTKQLKGLQDLYSKYKSMGLVVVGFPSNDFKQEDLKGEAIASFCELNYGVNFPLFEKTAVTGADRHPVYSWLVQNSGSPNDEVAWNFEKFLVSKEGKILGRYKAAVTPDDKNLNAKIAEALAQK